MLVRQLLRSCCRRGRTFATKTAPVEGFQILDTESFRKFQAQTLQELNPDQFNEVSLYHFIGDFLVKPERPDIPVAQKMIDEFLFKVPSLDPKGELTTLFLIQLLDSDALDKESKAVDLIGRILNFKAAKKTNIDLTLTPFMLEYTWEQVIKNHANNAGQALFDICAKSSSQLQEIGFAFSAEFKEHLLVDLFLPCRNDQLIDRIVSKSVSNNAIGIKPETLVEVFKAALQPDPDDLYHDSEMFSESTVQPRFQKLLQVLERWKSAGIPIKGEVVSAALSTVFQDFLPTEKMLQDLQALA